MQTSLEISISHDRLSFDSVLLKKLASLVLETVFHFQFVYSIYGTCRSVNICLINRDQEKSFGMVGAFS